MSEPSIGSRVNVCSLSLIFAAAAASCSSETQSIVRGTERQEVIIEKRLSPSARPSSTAAACSRAWLDRGPFRRKLGLKRSHLLLWVLGRSAEEETGETVAARIRMLATRAPNHAHQKFRVPAAAPLTRPRIVGDFLGIIYAQSDIGTEAASATAAPNH